MAWLKVSSVVAMSLVSAVVRAEPVHPSIAVDEMPTQRVTRLSECLSELAPTYDANRAAHLAEERKLRAEVQTLTGPERRAKVAQLTEFARSRPRAKDLFASVLTCGTGTVAFEPLTDALAMRVRTEIEGVLDHMRRRGDLAWTQRATEAYYVRCGMGVATQGEVARGLLVCNIGVAYLRPAEFDIVRIEIKTADFRSE